MDNIHLFLLKKNRLFFLHPKRKIRDSHVVAPTFLYVKCKLYVVWFNIKFLAIFYLTAVPAEKCRIVTPQNHIVS